MGTLVKPFTPSNGVVIDAVEYNANLDTLYTGINGGIDTANIAANGVGTSQIANDAVNDLKIDWGTGTNQVNLDSIPNGSTSKLGQDCSTTGSPVFAGGRYTGALNLWSGADLNIYSDTGTTLKFAVDGATGDTRIAAGRKFYFDLPNNLYAASINSTDYGFYSGSNLILTVGGNNIALTSGYKLYLDSGVSDYFIHSASGQNDLIANGHTVFRTIADGGLQINNYLDLGGNRLYLNAATSDYWIRSGLGQNDLYSNGTLTLRTNSSGQTAFQHDISVPTGERVILDGVSGNDYLSSDSNGVNRLVAAGTTALTTNSSGELLFANVDPPTANYANRNGIVKGWAYISSTGSITASYNVSSVSKTGAGTYVVNWNTDFSTGNYVCSVTPMMLAAGYTAQINIANQTVDHTEVRTQNGFTLSDANFSIMAIGTQ